MTTPIQQYIGDTWVFPIQVLAGGQPVDLDGYTVGAELFLAEQATPVDLTLASGAVVFANAAGGSFQITVAQNLQGNASAIAQTPNATVFPTRLQVWWIDTLNRRKTLGILPIIPLDPRSAIADSNLPLGIVSTTISVAAGGVGVVSIGGEQGPPGPSSTPRTYPVTIAAVGQTIIPLPVPPAVPSSVRLIVNGESFAAPDITISSVAVTWANAAFGLEPSDTVVLSYV